MSETGGLLLVHAHPDDESINTGATMAHYASLGVPVTLVTCTRGEAGEVIPPELAHLSGDALGRHREGELASALSLLGGVEGVYLGAPRVFRDSGMAYAADGTVVPDPATPADAFAKADASVSASLLDEVLARVRPAVVVTYEEGGGYGHPDHVRAHDVTMLALDLAAAAGRPVARVFEIVAPETSWRSGLASIGEDPSRRAPSMVVPDASVTTCIDGGPSALAAKTAALRAHATQVVVGEGWYALSNHVRNPLTSAEHFRPVRGTSAPADDLFA